ncbi:MAG TPA: MATE family efflux transporter, partial [Chlamydiales bacterium]|nr:MATE family efflux transporter [Chlamydiales bacterium]
IFWKDLYPDISLIKKMMRLGFPSSIEQSTRALGMIAMTFLVASFDTLTIAAYGIGSRILSFVIIPALGLSMATSTLVGQNMGAGKIQRAKSIVQMSSWVGFIGLSLIGLLFFIFAQQISSIFIPDETETIVMSASFLKIMSLTYGFIGLQMAINGSFRGSGNTFISMMLAIISMWVLRFPLAYLLSNTNLGQIGIWIAFPVSNIIAGIIAMIWYVKGDWATKVLTEEIKLTTEATKEALIQEGSD